MRDDMLRKVDIPVEDHDYRMDNTELNNPPPLEDASDELQNNSNKNEPIQISENKAPIRSYTLMSTKGVKIEIESDSDNDSENDSEAITESDSDSDASVKSENDDKYESIFNISKQNKVLVKEIDDKELSTNLRSPLIQEIDNINENKHDNLLSEKTNEIKVLEQENDLIIRDINDDVNKINDERKCNKLLIEELETENNNESLIEKSEKTENNKLLVEECETSENNRPLIEELETSENNKLLIEELETSENNKLLIEELETSENNKLLVEELETSENNKPLVEELEISENKKSFTEELETHEETNQQIEELDIDESKKPLNKELEISDSKELTIEENNKELLIEENNNHEYSNKIKNETKEDKIINNITNNNNDDDIENVSLDDLNFDKPKSLKDTLINKIKTGSNVIDILNSELKSPSLTRNIDENDTDSVDSEAELIIDEEDNKQDIHNNNEVIQNEEIPVKKESFEEIDYNIDEVNSVQMTTRNSNDESENEDLEAELIQDIE